MHKRASKLVAGQLHKRASKLVAIKRSKGKDKQRQDKTRLGKGKSTPAIGFSAREDEQQKAKSKPAGRPFSPGDNLDLHSHSCPFDTDSASDLRSHLMTLDDDSDSADDLMQTTTIESQTYGSRVFRNDGAAKGKEKQRNKEKANKTGRKIVEKAGCKPPQVLEKAGKAKKDGIDLRNIRVLCQLQHRAEEGTAETSRPCEEFGPSPSAALGRTTARRSRLSAVGRGGRRHSGKANPWAATTGPAPERRKRKEKLGKIKKK